MANPYSGRPDYTFWRQGVTDAAPNVDPVVSPPFTLDRMAKIATAGSCFAQHISRTLVENGFTYLVTENYHPAPGVTDESFGVFPARFGNIYTARQLVQLFDRAYGTFSPLDTSWVGRNGTLIDPFRPRIQEAGFPSREALEEDRLRHFAAVRNMFEQCELFIFTLGLTEAWMSAIDGAVFPLAPGVVSPDADPAAYRFHNFGVGEVVKDVIGFLDRLQALNTRARVLLTVSPVPLIATYEDRHVLTSTIASKSILRAAVEDVQRQRPATAYFPSYEIITGPQAGGRFFEDDLREINPRGVEYVMSLFRKHYLNGEAIAAPAAPPPAETAQLSAEDEQRMRELAAIICDEEAIIS